MFTLLVCADLYGSKVNLEVAFNGVPGLTELVQQVEHVFAQEARAIQPPGYPLIQDVKIDRIQIYDDTYLKWIDIADSSQLHEYDQLYCFQPRSQWHVDLQKDLPAPRPPSAPKDSVVGQGGPPSQPGAGAYPQQQPQQQQYNPSSGGSYQPMPQAAQPYPSPSQQPQSHPGAPPSQPQYAAPTYPGVSPYSPRNDAVAVPPGSPAGCQISTYGANGQPSQVQPQPQQPQPAPTPSHPQGAHQVSAYGAYPPPSSPAAGAAPPSYGAPAPYSAAGHPPAMVLGSPQPQGAALVAGERPNIPKDQKIQRVWAEMDVARKGWLDVSEFEHAFRVREIDFNISTVQELFGKADVDRSGRIDWQKWCRWCELYPNTLEVMYYRGEETHLDEGIKRERMAVQQAIDANRAREADLRRQLEECGNEFNALSQRMVEFDTQSSANMTRRSILLQQERDLLEQEIKLERQKDQLRASQYRFQEAAQIFDQSAVTHGSPRRAAQEPVHQFR